jgi:hypothetical protein
MGTRNIVLFGASERARTVVNTAPGTDRFLFIADNNARLHGSLYANLPVLAPATIRQAHFDFIRITSGATEAIRSQLLQLGVPEEKIRVDLWDPLPDVEYLRSLKNRHRGRRAFVVGNGPSLTIADLDRLHANGEVSLAFNKIYLAFAQTPYRPTYYMVEDPLVAENNFCVINNLRGFPKLFPHRLRPWFARDADTRFFNLVWDIRFPNPPQFNPDPEQMYWGSTVTYPALQWAVYLGCNPIYLIGMDFNFVEPSTKEMGGKVLVGGGERNHFHPDYRPVGERWYVPNLHHQEISFGVARGFAEANGIQMLNATRGGKLEVFPRADFDRLF